MASSVVVASSGIVIDFMFKHVHRVMVELRRMSDETNN